MKLFLRQERKWVSAKFVLADNKATGFSSFTDTMIMPVVLKPGYELNYGDAIHYRLYAENGEDVTDQYALLLADIDSKPIQPGQRAARLRVAKKNPRQQGKMFLYAWVHSYDEEPGTKFDQWEHDEVDLRAKQFEDLANKYKPPVKKIEPLLPTREASRLAGLFGFFEEDRNKMLKDAGFTLPEEE